MVFYIKQAGVMDTVADKVSPGWRSSNDAKGTLVRSLNDSSTVQSALAGALLAGGAGMLLHNDDPNEDTLGNLKKRVLKSLAWAAGGAALGGVSATGYNLLTRRGGKEKDKELPASDNTFKDPIFETDSGIPANGFTRTLGVGGSAAAGLAANKGLRYLAAGGNANAQVVDALAKRIVRSSGLAAHVPPDQLPAVEAELANHITSGGRGPDASGNREGSFNKASIEKVLNRLHSAKEVEHAEKLRTYTEAKQRWQQEYAEWKNKPDFEIHNVNGQDKVIHKGKAPEFNTPKPVAPTKLNANLILERLDVGARHELANASNDEVDAYRRRGPKHLGQRAKNFGKFGTLRYHSPTRWIEPKGKLGWILAALAATGSGYSAFGSREKAVGKDIEK
jgi:hypothetical protein